MARAPAANSRDPRFRSFRVGAYSVYFAIVGTFCVLLIRSVVISLENMAPPKLESRPALTFSECAHEAERLWGELDTQRQRLTQEHPAIHADDAWTRFRTQWMGELRRAEAQCGVTLPEREELRRTFKLLVKTQDLYTTHAVQFSGEVGPTVDELQDALEAVKRLR